MPNRPYKRVDRIADVIRKVVSETLLSRVHHRGLEGVTITDVEVSPDLHHAYIYYRVLDRARVKDTGKALGKSAFLIQRQVNHEMKTRYVPHLKFKYDDTLERGNHIEDLLKTVRVDEEE